MWDKLKEHFVTYALSLILGAVVYSSVTSYRAESGLNNLKADFGKLGNDFSKYSKDLKQDTGDARLSFQTNIDTKLSNITSDLVNIRSEVKSGLESHKIMIQGLRNGLAKVAKKTDALDEDVLKDLIIIGSNIEKLGDDNLLKQLKRQESMIARLEHDIYRIKIKDNNNRIMSAGPALASPQKNKIHDNVLQQLYKNEEKLHTIALSYGIRVCKKGIYSSECRYSLNHTDRHLGEAKYRMGEISRQVKQGKIDNLSLTKLKHILEELKRIDYHISRYE